MEYGPLLMALVGAEDLAVPVDKLSSFLSPIAGNPLHFNVDGFSKCKYIPYWQIEKEEFTCFPTMC
jgi:hypothetical protein